ncbi:MAG TPA: hypothetical protein VF768_01620, partial [Holophagaceae bacterium]
RIRPFRPGFQFWFEVNFAAWSLAVMPVTAALVSELSWEQEREARAWDRLFSQPLPRWTHYMVKVAGHLLLVLGAETLLAFLLLLGGKVLQSRPGLLMGPLPWATWWRLGALAALGTLSIVAFQTWLSLRLRGIWAGLTAALAGSWICGHLGGSSGWVQALPWGLAAQFGQIFDRWRPLPWGYSTGSLLAGVVLVILGTWDFSRMPELRSR